MRRLVSVFCTAINLGLTGPAIATIAPDQIAYPTSETPAFLGQSAQVDGHCQLEIFSAGDYPMPWQNVQQITCLDQMCHRREVMICIAAN